MDIAIFPRPELRVALGALRTIHPEPDRSLDRFIDVIGRLHGVDVDWPVPAASPEETAAAIQDPHRRKRLLQLAVITSMVDGRIEDSETDAVDRLARALEIDDRSTRSIRHLAARHNLIARIGVTRRIFGKFGGEAWREEGLAGVRKLVAAMMGRGVDPAVAARYQELRHQPEGSFGRVFWEHITERKFAFPGEKGGIPERAVFHDLGHVLAGYDTDPAGEIQQAAFQSGFVRRDGFAFLFFGIVQFHLGVKMTPIADGEVGHFDVDKVMTALARGAACKVDLSDRWDYWPLMSRPIDEVRAELGITPLA